MDNLIPYSMEPTRVLAVAGQNLVNFVIEHLECDVKMGIEFYPREKV